MCLCAQLPFWCCKMQVGIFELAPVYLKSVKSHHDCSVWYWNAASIMSHLHKPQSRGAWKRSWRAWSRFPSTTPVLSAKKACGLIFKHDKLLDHQEVTALYCSCIINTLDQPCRFTSQLLKFHSPNSTRSESLVDSLCPVIPSHLEDKMQTDSLHWNNLLERPRTSQPLR